MEKILQQIKHSGFFMCSIEGSLMKYSHSKSKCDPQSAPCGRQGDSSTACLSVEGWFYTTKPEQGMSWCKWDCTSTDWSYTSVWNVRSTERECGQGWDRIQRRVMPTTTIFRFFTGGAKAKTWINLDFPHFFHYTKSFQIVPGIDSVPHLDRMDQRSVQLESLRYSHRH